MSENKNIVAAAQDTLRLFNLLAEDFQPRTHKQLVELAANHGYDWSAAKLSNMLATLAAEKFLRQAPSGEWSLAPQITAIAVNYQQSIIRRAQSLMDEVAEIKTQQEGMA